MKLIFKLFLVFLVATSCTKTESHKHSLELKLKGDMLFIGANTLQMPVNQNASALMNEAGLNNQELKAIEIEKISVELNETQHDIIESVLLQVVSDNNDMLTLGTINPIPKGMVFDLSLAEETDLLPYFEDANATWVMDVNIKEDYMDLMEVGVMVNIDLKHKSK